MVDITTITSLIGSLGFPIAACIALFWKMNKQDEFHKEEMDNLKDAVANNTLAIQKLTDLLEGGGADDTN